MADPVIPTPQQAARALEIESLRATLDHVRGLLLFVVALHERMLSLLTTVWGFWLLSPWWDTFASSRTFAGLRESGAYMLAAFAGWFLPSLPAALVSEFAFGGAGRFWGAIIMTMGILQALASFRGSVYQRQVVATFSGGFWLYIAISFASINFAGTSTPVYTWLALNMWLKVYVLTRVHDVVA